MTETSALNDRCSPARPRATDVSALAYVVVAIVVVALAVLVRAAVPELIPCAVAGAISLVVAAILLPATRLRRDQWLTPKNWMNFGWILVLVVVPFEVAILGPTQGTLSHVPSAGDMVHALAWQLLAYWMWATGYSLASIRRRAASSSPPQTQTMKSASNGFISVLVVLGLFGIWLRFRSMSSMIQYFAGRADITSVPVGSAGVSGLLGLVLPPLLALAGIEIAFRKKSSGPTLKILGLGLVVLGTAVYNYNRAGVFVGLVAYLAVWSWRTKRLRATWLLSIAGLAAILAFFIGQYRTVYFATQGGQVSRSQAGVKAGQLAGARETLEAYFRAPQYVGSVSDAFRPEIPPAHELFNDVVSPVPSLGQPYRADTTSVSFSEAVRGELGVVDSAPPMYLELLMTLGSMAIVPFFLGFGALGCITENGFVKSRTALASYSWMFLGVWEGYLLVGSLQFFIQTLVQFGSGFALFLFLRNRMTRKVQGQ